MYKDTSVHSTQSVWNWKQPKCSAISPYLGCLWHFVWGGVAGDFNGQKVLYENHYSSSGESWDFQVPSNSEILAVFASVMEEKQELKLKV